MNNLKNHQAVAIGVFMAGCVGMLFALLGWSFDRSVLGQQVNLYVAATRHAANSQAIKSLERAAAGLETMGLQGGSAHEAILKEVNLRQSGQLKHRLTSEETSRLARADLRVRDRWLTIPSKRMIGIGGTVFLLSIILYGLTGRTKYMFA